MKSVDEIIAVILAEKPSLKIGDIREMIKRKTEELGELVDEYVIALMVAKELGVSIPKEGESLKVSKLRICDLIAGLRNVNLVARVVKIDREIIFSRNGKTRKCLRIGIGDATGIINLVLWDDQIEQIKNVRIGDIIQVSRGYTREYRGKVELYLGSGGKISLVEGEIPPLEYFLENYEQECTLLQVKNVLQLHEFACIRGIDFKGRRIRILIWGGLGDNLKEECYYVCGLKRKYESRDFVEYYTNRNKVTFTPYRANIPSIDYKVYTPSYIDIEEARDLILRGCYLALNPTKFPKIFLGDERNFIQVLLTSDDVFLSILDSDPGCDILLEGVDIVKGSRGRIVKMGRCGHIRVIGPSKLFSSEKPPERFIIESEGFCTLKGAVISLDFKFRLMKTESSEKIASFCSLLIDDGTGQARIYSSSPDIIKNLLAMSEGEALDYLKAGVLDKIVAYMKKEVLGKNFNFECFVYVREEGNRVGIASSISTESGEG